MQKMGRPASNANGSAGMMPMHKGKMPRKMAGGSMQHPPLSIPTSKMPKSMGGGGR